MRIDVQGVDLPRVLLYLDVLEGLRCSRTDPRDVVGEDTAVCACRVNVGVTLPLGITDIQHIGAHARLGPGGRQDGRTHVDALIEAKVEAVGVVEDNGLEDMRAGEDDGATVTGDVKGGDGGTDGMESVLRLARTVCDGVRGRCAGDGEVGRRVLGRRLAQEFAHCRCRAAVNQVLHGRRHGVGCAHVVCGVRSLCVVDD